ncbi:MAG: exodeoxyribonuclease V subunit gamma, partial [Nocardioides sp.]|nr:exodeoxyribonuclease V subunit gamma [Nocardioides sp.]
GLLPPAELGRRTLREVVEKLRPIVEQALPLREGTARSVDVDVDLGDGRRLTGTVEGIFGTRLVSVRYARLGARQRLEAWINLLAVSATRPDEHWTSHALGGSRAGASLALAGPVDHRATTWLRELVDLRDRGLREPLPFPLKTALAYAEESYRLRCGADAHPDERATKEWQTDRYNAWGIPGEDADVAHVRVFGQYPPYSLLAGPPAPDEDWNDEPHRLGRIAWRVWGPLLEGAERVTAR